MNLRKILNSFSLAWHNLKSNWLHTFFSVLGIIIGVAALVTILSLIDGMEYMVREQIFSTTSLQSVIASVDTHEEKDGLKVKREDYMYFTYARVDSALQFINEPTKAYMRYKETVVINKADTGKLAISLSAVTEHLAPKVAIRYGRSFSKEELLKAEPKIIVDSNFVAAYFANLPLNEALGKEVGIRDEKFTIVGVTEPDKKVALAYMPITRIPDKVLAENNTMLYLEPDRIEKVREVKGQFEEWLKTNFPDKAEQVTLITSEFRLEQMEKGTLAFKIVMGLITGISVLVGGIGIMNVLLISITERTTEIGIRKATGAKKSDILWQFLSESITISGFGSFLGLALGLGVALLAAPIITIFIEMEFEAKFTLSTMAVIGVLAIFIGVVFGTYPAMRAAKLDPVEAIRRE